MRSIVLVGAARSGAGVAAGMLARAGVSFGGRTGGATRASPRGTFVSEDVAALNERLLADPENWPSDTDAREMRAIVERRPYCLHDPRFARTLHLWRGALGGAAFVCVFRHPAAAAAAMVERDGVSRDEALRDWCDAHRRILEEHRREGDWLFVRYEDLLAPGGRARLAQFLDAELAEGFADPTLRRALPSEDGAGAEAEALHAELQELVGPAEPLVEVDPDAAPEVATAVVLGDSDLPRLPRLLADLRAQRAVRHEIVLADATLDGALGEVEGATVVRAPSPSRGLAYRAALEATDAPWIALQDPAARPQANRLARQLAFAREREGALLVTSDVGILRGEEIARRLFHDASDTHPPPFWESGVLVRREALAKIDRACFVPAELDLATRLRRVKRVAHQPELLAAFDEELAGEREARVRHDAELVRLARVRGPEEPEVTVLLATHDRRDVLLECLEAFSRQLVPRGTFELLVADDASSDGTPELAGDMRLPVPYRFVRRESQAGACAARNAVLSEARGRLVLFANDDTIPFPDLVRRHLEAHRELADHRAVVLGTFEQPPEELDGALARLLEGTELVFAYPRFRPGDELDGVHFYTCNTSVPAEAVRSVGPFDERFPCYAEDTDYGVRLEEAGWRVHYRPEARAIHRHPPTFEGIRWRQRAVARAHVRLYAKHPRVLPAVWARQTDAAIRARTERVGKSMPDFEAACRTLAELDLGVLERAGEPCAATARALEERLAELLPKLNVLWWQLGFQDGFRELGVGGFPDLLARAAAGDAQERSEERSEEREEETVA